MLLDGLLLLLDKLVFFTGYIGQSNSFPKPLDSEEEAKYIQLCAEGDEHAKNILIEHNLRLVAHIAKKYNNSADNDDLISIGTIGLIKAVSTFNAGKGIQLATYASKCVENEIRMTLRAIKKYKNDMYLQDPVGVDKEGNKITLTDILGTDANSVIDDVEAHIAASQLNKAIKEVLTKRERVIIEMRYGIGNIKYHTQREVAAILGISRSYVSRIEKKALEKLKKRFEMDGKIIMPLKKKVKR